VVHECPASGRLKRAGLAPAVVVTGPHRVAHTGGADAVHRAEALVCTGAVAVIEH
jgi:hypothetical protein